MPVLGLGSEPVSDDSVYEIGDDCVSRGVTWCERIMELDPTNEIRICRSLLVGSDDPQCRISERLFGLAAVGFRTIFDGMNSLNDEEAPDSLVQICANDSRELRFLELEADIPLEAVYRQGSQKQARRRGTSASQGRRSMRPERAARGWRAHHVHASGAAGWAGGEHHRASDAGYGEFSAR